MVTMIISFFVLVLSFNFFMLSYQINGINRLVLGTPIALFETAINMYNIDEDEGPYFIKEKLEDNLTSYFNYSIVKYTRDYNVSFYYYDPSTGAICLDDETIAVQVTVSAELILSYTYQKTMSYEIRSF